MDGVGFRVRDRVGIRDRDKVRCGFGFVCFSLSKLELKVCPYRKKQVHRIEFPNMTPELQVKIFDAWRVQVNHHNVI